MTRLSGLALLVPPGLVALACNAVFGLDPVTHLDAEGGAAEGGGGSGATGGKGGNAGGGKGGASNGGSAGSGATGGGGGSGGDAGGAGEISAGGTGGSGGDGGGVTNMGGEGGEGTVAMICVPDQRSCMVNTAVQCNADGTDYLPNPTDCSATQTCVLGMCEDHECVPESVFCSGNSLRECAANGLSSTETELCDTAEYCDAADPSCKIGVCSPGQPACDVNIATTCNSQGSGYVAGGTPCGANTTCQAGVCQPQVCTPNAGFCQGQDFKRCSPNGLTSTVEDACSSSEYCSEAAMSCQTRVCTPGTRDCTGSTARLCNDEGSGYTTEDCAGTGFCDASVGSCRTLAEMVGSLDGYLVQFRCADTPNADDCANSGALVNGTVTACTGSQLNYQVTYPIGGTTGVTYQATVHFYGIVEPRTYAPGLTRESGSTRPANLDTGASPAPWGTAPGGTTFNNTAYNNYEIRVVNQNNQETAVYVVNSDTAEGHYTYVLNFARTIPIVGGGSVRFRVFDSNCRIIKNCANGGAPCGTKARTVDISAASPQPSGLVQPGLGQAPEHSGQWILFDVTGIQ